jgi:hypothetical protein
MARVLVLIGIVGIVVACGGDGGEATVPGSGDGPVATTSTTSASAPAASTSSVEIPVARFTAHGPQAGNTIGPACADGIEPRGGDIFRFTPPDTWTWRGTSGGTGSDEVTFDGDGATMFVRVSGYDYDTANLFGWEVVGPSGIDLDLGGEAVPMMEVKLGDRDGYAIVDLPYLGPLPLVTAGSALGTVILTSDDPERPTVDEARELLSTVRVERCEAVAQALIWGPAAGVHLVPRFEPDPLGKTYPDQEFPSFDPTVSALRSYTVEQLAYLLPVDESLARCVAERIQEEEDSPIAHLLYLAPSGNNKEALAEIVAGC